MEKMDFDFRENIVLENSHVRLEALGISARTGLAEVARTNPNLLQYSPMMINSTSEFEAYFEAALQARLEKVRYAFSIFDKMNKVYAGSTSFGHVSNRDRRIEVGWTWIGSNFQRTGLNRNCKMLLMEYVFEKLQFDRLELKTDARNEQSRKAIEGIGGKLEGVLRSHTVMSDGYRRDTVYYSILKPEWNEIKSGLIKS